MDELKCNGCGDHVGWMTDSGPRGLVYCDSCYEGYEEDEDES